jgi:hypothetical protein
MWIFTVYGFYSVACADKQDEDGNWCIDPDNLMVRARVKQHLENLKERFGLDGKIVESSGTDYLFRMFVPKQVWAACLEEMAKEQSWSNFKSECEHHIGRVGKPYVNALHRIWHVMFGLQPQRNKTQRRSDALI